MMTKAFVLCTFLFMNGIAIGQFQFGVKANYTLTFNKSQEIKYDDELDFLLYKIKFIEQDVSPIFSVFGFFKNDLLFIQAELGYRQIKTRFSSIYFLTFDDLEPKFETKTRSALILPIQAGIHFNSFKFGGGPVLSIILSENAIFQEIDFFEERNRKLNVGLRIGFGIQFFHLHLDVSFEQRFNGVAESFYFRGDNKGFHGQSQFLNLGLGYLF